MTAIDSSRVVLVTGASSGIGRACTLSLVREGYRVFGTTRRSADEVATDLLQEPGSSDRLAILRMDVDDEDSVTRAVDQVVNRAGRIDGLINCAGFGIAGSVEDTAIDEVKAIFETNLFGTLRVCRAVLPIMREQRTGTIINISSIMGRIALPFQGLYSATKFAVEGASEALRMEVQPFGVRVVLIEPGDFRTGFTDTRLRVQGAQQGGVYAERFRTALSVAESDERSGASPETIGHLVIRILAARSPRLRYLVGPAMQCLAARLKSVLPSRLFEWSLRKYYRVD